MAFYPDETIAILIDGSNLHSTCKVLDFDIDYSKLLELFKACLLYTSPSPRDQRGSRMPSSA